MQPLRQADRVDTRLSVVVRDCLQRLELEGIQLSSNGIVLGGIGQPDEFDGHMPREIAFELPGGRRVDAWAQPVRRVGGGVAFRLLGLGRDERESISRLVYARVQDKSLN